MQPLSKKNTPDFQKKEAILSNQFVHISVGKCGSFRPSLEKFLKILYPGQSIHWNSKPNFEEIDTYVLFYLCPYDVEEHSLLIQAIKKAKQIFIRKKLKSETHLLIILYRDIKVAFPERKLQREKVMSEMIDEEILRNVPFIGKEHLQIVNEFGTNNLQDSIQGLKGTHFYFEIIVK